MRLRGRDSTAKRTRRAGCEGVGGERPRMVSSEPRQPFPPRLCLVAPPSPSGESRPLRRAPQDERSRGRATHNVLAPSSPDGARSRPCGVPATREHPSEAPRPPRGGGPGAGCGGRGRRPDRHVLEPVGPRGEVPEVGRGPRHRGGTLRARGGRAQSRPGRRRRRRRGRGQRHREGPLAAHVVVERRARAHVRAGTVGHGQVSAPGPPRPAPRPPGRAPPPLPHLTAPAPPPPRRDKFGASFDVRLVRRGKQMYLHVMWKYLEMKR